MDKIYEFEVFDRCLYWKQEKTLIIGDLHLGYEELLNNRGYALPRSQQEENYQILERVFQKLRGKIEKVIFLGDIKHYFGGILKQEFQEFEDLILFLKNKLKKEVEIIITKGNHDNILSPLLEKYANIKLVDYYLEKNTLFIHGDSGSVNKAYKEMHKKETKFVILGHFHPAFVLKDKNGIKQEKYKCFLYGYSLEFKKEVIFVPSFFPLIEGSDIINELEIYNPGMKVVAITDEGKTYLFDPTKS